MSVMKLAVPAAAMLALCVMGASGGAKAGGVVTFASPQVAFEQGLNAYRTRHFEIAIPALQHAAKNDNILAMFYLARIYSDNSRVYTDHARAYALYSKIVDRFYDVDPSDFRRAPTVAKSITAMARYVQHGIKEIKLRPNVADAVRLYRYAAQFYNEPEAQFQLAKLQLVGDGVKKDVRNALYWFGRLVKRGHPSAQAFLADLYWRGAQLTRDPERALALITVARRNAPPHELIWIDDLYQDIFCGTRASVRANVQARVAGWASQFGEPRRLQSSRSMDWFPAPARTCRDGTPVTLPQVGSPELKEAGEKVRETSPTSAKPDVEAKTKSEKKDTSLMMGLTSTFTQKP